jgi:hypothetical protein
MTRLTCEKCRPRPNGAQCSLPIAVSIRARGRTGPNALSCRCPVRSLLAQQLVGLTKNSVVTSPLALIVK